MSLLSVLMTPTPPPLTSWLSLAALQGELDSRSSEEKPWWTLFRDGWDQEADYEHNVMRVEGGRGGGEGWGWSIAHVFVLIKLRCLTQQWHLHCQGPLMHEELLISEHINTTPGEDKIEANGSTVGWGHQEIKVDPQIRTSIMKDA